MSSVAFRINQKEDCWSSCDSMKEAVCKYASYPLLETKNNICLNYHNNNKLSFFTSSNHIHSPFRDGEDMARGKCTLKLKCEPESQYCTCFSNVICISPSSKVEGSLSKKNWSYDNICNL